MPRPIQTRKIEFVPRVNCFKPVGVPLTRLQETALTLDELDACAWPDLNGLYQEAAAEKMDISRSAFARTLESARRKIADALIHGNPCGWKAARSRPAPAGPASARATVRAATEGWRR
jgi:predicted DNA-binding protein (UPF0251 family)